jgi:hypothetical protein
MCVYVSMQTEDVSRVVYMGTYNIELFALQVTGLVCE